jgi:hypothetical protein
MPMVDHLCHQSRLKRKGYSVPTYALHKIVGVRDGVAYYQSSGLSVTSYALDDAIDTVICTTLHINTNRDFMFGLQEIEQPYSQDACYASHFIPVTVENGKVINKGWVEFPN